MTAPVKFSDVIERVRTNSRVNPTLWLCGLVLLFGFSTLPFLKWYIAAPVLLLMFMVVGFALWQIRYFTLTNPIHLGSEDHALRASALEKMGDSSNEIDVINAILNPSETKKKPKLLAAPKKVKGEQE